MSAKQSVTSVSALTLKTLSVSCLILLASCATDSPVPRSDRCAGWRIILIDPANDQLTRGTAEQILVHNETGLSFRCWNEKTQNVRS